MELIIALAFSGLCGYLAAKFMNLSSAWYIYVLLGIAGGFVGSFVFGLLGLGSRSVLGDVIVSVIGAMIVVFLYRLLTEKRR